MARDADRTRKRLLTAATDEFAALGIAGARIDRIAAAAGCNKAMIYAYFGNKDRLFEASFAAHVAGFLEQVPFDVADLHQAERADAGPAVLVRPDGYIAWAGDSANRSEWLEILARWTGPAARVNTVSPALTS